jgi:serine protease
MMNKIGMMVVGLCALLFSSTANAVEIVVDFRDGTWNRTAMEVGEGYHLHLRPNSEEMVGSDAMYIADVPEADVARVLANLHADSRIEAAEVNAEVTASFIPNDPLYPQQWGLTRVGLERSSQITCGRGAVVAVVDTGVACETRGTLSQVTDLAGTRCLRGWNFVGNNDHAGDDQGHGTHVAGTIAQTTNNGVGGAGVAFCTTILPVKVLNYRGSGTLADVAEGIRWAADHGADVINLSLGSDSRSTSETEAAAVKYAHDRGTAVICAAGNNGRFVGSPANAPFAFAVSAVDNTDTIASFSSRGPLIAIAAPGVNILQQTICNNGREGCEQYVAWSGTSMATPHVAAVAGLLYSVGITDPLAVENAIRRYSDRPSHGDLNPEFYGSGILNADNAVRGVLWQTGVVRLALLSFLALGLYYWIKNKKGEFTTSWIFPALVTGVGCWFLPMIVGHSLPFVDFLMRPIVEWDSLVTGAHFHRWLPLANAGFVLGVVGLGFGRGTFRGPISGIALGTAAYLLSTIVTGAVFMPLGFVMQILWVTVNVAACLWVARVGIDTSLKG